MTPQNADYGMIRTSRSEGDNFGWSESVLALSLMSPKTLKLTPNVLSLTSCNLYFELLLHPQSSSRELYEKNIASIKSIGG